MDILTSILSWGSPLGIGLFLLLLSLSASIVIKAIAQIK